MKKIFFFIAFAVFLAQASFAHAASFFISPGVGTYSVGDIVTVHINVNSEGAAVNAVSGLLNFPSNLLSISSISKSTSKVNFWTVDPVQEGSRVHFEGVILNPGYTGPNAAIVTVNFKVIASGSATLTYSSAAILANDGLGTNILNKTSGATYTLVGKTQEEKPKPAPTSPTATVESPIITSATHPNQNGWYQNNTPIISWIVPDDVIGVVLLVNQTPVTNPGTHSSGRITGYNIEKLSDGVSYAHVRFENDSGWGPVTNYRLGIDTVPPSKFTIAEAATQTDPSAPLFTLTAKDASSGIDHYTFAIDGGAPITVPFTDIWQTPSLPPGEHTMKGEVFDKAGNSLKTTYQFATTGVAAPTIDTYPKGLTSGDTLTISGHTYPNAKIEIILNAKLNDLYSFGTIIYRQQGGEIIPVPDVTADATGVFTFTYGNKVENGSYSVSARANDGTYKGPSSTVVTIPVARSVFERIIQFIMEFFDFAILILLLAVLIIGLVWYVTRRYYVFRKRIQRDLLGIDKKVEEQIEMLKKIRAGEPLKEHEMVFLEKLERDIQAAKRDAHINRDMK